MVSVVEIYESVLFADLGANQWYSFDDQPTDIRAYKLMRAVLRQSLVDIWSTNEIYGWH